MFKAKVFVVSALLHAILFFLLALQFDNKHKKDPIYKNKAQAIQSFLYTPIVVPQPTSSQIVTLKKIPLQTSASNKELSKNLSKKESITKHPKKQLQPVIPNTVIQTQVSSNKRITRNSLQAQINALNSKEIKIAPSYKKRSNIKSIFNQSPLLVPKSTTQSELQKEEDKKRQVTSYGDIAITKGKDGNCSVTQDLSSVGIDGVSATQHFNCGKSEFDTNFDNHMKKAMKKYQ